jgi:shikimate dehydrogenase
VSDPTPVTRVATPTAATQVAAVIGAPVRHSLSPVIHNAAFAAAGLDWVFVALEVAPGRAADAVAAMRVLGLRGLAVTMPHKHAVSVAVDEVDQAAAALRSVNTVVLRDDGSTFGASTDGAGFVASLEAAGHTVAGCTFAVLGAGGAARAVVDALGRAGAADVAVVNRTADRAYEAAALAAAGRVADASAVRDADVVVNATSVGMNGTDASGADLDGGDTMPCDPASLRAGQVVVDLVYHPLETQLLRAARRAGAATVDGLGMLVHQAALQQRWWTGHVADPAVMRDAALAELAARRR